MLEAVEGNIHQRLCALLDEHRARYRVMAHEAVGQCRSRLGNPRHRAWPGRESVGL